MNKEQSFDVLATAIEGGITYWLSECDDVKVHSDDYGAGDWHYDGVEFTREGKDYYVTAADLRKRHADFIKYARAELRGIKLDENPAMYDAETADAFFQFCAFGAAIFG